MVLTFATMKRFMTRAVVEPDGKGMVVESRRYPETPVSWLMRKKNAVFVHRPFWFRNSGIINITVARARGLMPMKLLQLNKLQHF